MTGPLHPGYYNPLMLPESDTEAEPEPVGDEGERLAEVFDQAAADYATIERNQP